MRVLVAGRNAKVLAKVAGAFAGDLTMETVATKAAAIALLQRVEFDLVLACEKLGDGSGLEVLSHVAVNTPNTLRIFAARPSTLSLLKGELGLFGLFRTLPYPINFRKLWSALDLARSCRPEPDPSPEPAGHTPRIRHVVLDTAWDTPSATSPNSATRPRHAASPASAAKSGSVGYSPSAANSRLAANARPPSTGSGRASAAPRTSNAGRPTANTGGAPGAPRPATAARASATPITTARPSRAANTGPSAAARRATAPGSPARIPESDAFKRARARRNDAKQRREPSVSNESLAQLAQLATTRRPTYGLRPAPGGRKRTALFVGSGVFAAGAAAVLTFFMLHTNNSIGQSSLSLVASINRPIPQKILPWQTPAPGPTPTTFVRSETVTPAAADMEVEAEAASEPVGIEPGHPPPPPPNPPPGPSEPPAYDESGMPIPE